MLFAQLVDDPSSHPDRFPTPEAVEAERERLFGIIEELVVWENSTDEEVLERARAEVRKSCGDELPPICDPFSGGGSIPLEAQRLGLPAYGSDLNPVAVMIGKATVEIPPRFANRAPAHPEAKERIHYRNAEGLAEDVKHFGEWMRQRAFERIGHLYPKVDLPKEHGGGTAVVIAWIWARTVPSPDPAFAGEHVPIASSFLLSSKKNKEAWIEPIVDKATKSIRYRSRTGGTKQEIATAKVGTKAGRANFRCLLSDSAITAEYVKARGKSGEIGQTLIAIVAEGKRGRIYLAPSDTHSATATSPQVSDIAQTCRDTLLSGETPARLTGGTCYGYGLDQWGKLFTDRQLVALSTFCDLVHESRAEIERDALAAGWSEDLTPLRDGGGGAKAYAEAVSMYLGFMVGQLANHCSTICGWNSPNQQMRSTFSRQALPMTWDFAEVNIFSQSSGSFRSLFNRMLKGFETLGSRSAEAVVDQSDALSSQFNTNSIISTDPPYYDNIAYADLSDFFFYWMKSICQGIYPDLFGILATPKQDELVATAYRHGSREAAELFFLDGMSKAIANMSRQSSSTYPATIYYAFKQREIDQEGISSTGWATFLQAVIDSGYSVVGTLPLRTEKPGRMVAIGTNALANSVVLVCRKRAENSETVGRAEFLRALKSEIPPAMEELRKANIAPADMPQSAIGPGMGVFSRYRAVLEADDSAMSVRTALQLINRELDEYLGGMEGEFDADTRFAVTWFEQNGMKAGDYGDANNIATARGISVDNVKHAEIVNSAAGRVRIRTRAEIDPDWDPAADSHLTVWECCQHLIRTLEQDGEGAAALLLKKMGPANAEAAKDLAYCLYDISANKRRDAAEAAAYNGLIAVWTELTRQAAAIPDIPDDIQGTLDL